LGFGLEKAPYKTIWSPAALPAKVYMYKCVIITYIPRCIYIIYFTPQKKNKTYPRFDAPTRPSGRPPPSRRRYVCITCKHHIYITIYIDHIFHPAEHKIKYSRFGFGLDAPYKTIWSSATLPAKVRMQKHTSIYLYICTICIRWTKSRNRKNPVSQVGLKVPCAPK